MDLYLFDEFSGIIAQCKKVGQLVTIMNRGRGQNGSKNETFGIPTDRAGAFIWSESLVICRVLSGLRAQVTLSPSIKTNVLVAETV